MNITCVPMARGFEYGRLGSSDSPGNPPRCRLNEGIPEPDRPEWGYDELRRAMDTAGVALLAWNVDTDDLAMDPRGYDLWGLSSQRNLTFELLSDKIHPADRDRVRDAFTATRVRVGAYGSSLVRRTIEDQLRGSVTYD